MEPCPAFGVAEPPEIYTAPALVSEGSSSGYDMRDFLELFACSLHTLLAGRICINDVKFADPIFSHLLIYLPG